jgi:hypothetical protein
MLYKVQKEMGGCTSKSRQYGKVSADGTINASKLRTGDLVFFTNNWSRSNVKRKVRAINDRLWTTGGIVINAPDLYQEPMLLEYQRKYTDDFLQDSITMQQKTAGVRLVSLVGRLNHPNYQACLVRRLSNDNVTAQISSTHDRVCAAMIHGIKDSTYPTPAHMIINSLANAGLLKATNLPVGVSLSDCTSKSLDEITFTPNLYSKGKIYVSN